jgi:hypothetical protein
MWETGYLDRPKAQNFKNRALNGSEYLVYAIGNKGALTLRDRFGADIEPSHWTQKNASLKPLTLQHSLSITRFMVRMAVATQAHENARMIYSDEFLPPSKGGRGLANTLRATVEWQGRRSEQGTAPDQIFGLSINGETQYFCLEIDEGTETIVPNKQRQQSARFWHETSILRKMLIYAAAFQQKAHVHQYKIPVFRVLTVTTNADRVAKMQDAFKQHLAVGKYPAKAGLFLFTDWEALEGFVGLQSDVVFENAQGASVGLAR